MDSRVYVDPPITPLIQDLDLYVHTGPVCLYTHAHTRNLHQFRGIERGGKGFNSL